MLVKFSFGTIGLILTLAGCDTAGPKEVTGALTGAVVGGVVGDQFGGGSGNKIATGVGVLIGGLVGSEIGRSLDDDDRIRANQAVLRSHSSPIGNTVMWNNPTSGNFGTVTPLRDGNTADGRYCREYQQTITVAGRRETGLGVACLQPDGTWRITS